MYGDKGEVPEGEYTLPIGLQILNAREQMSPSFLLVKLLR